MALKWIEQTGVSFTTQTQKRSHFEEDLALEVHAPSLAPQFLRPAHRAPRRPRRPSSGAHALTMP